MQDSDFKTPPAQYRIVPFWFWNGAMDEQEIARQIEEMAAKGVGGFFLCARQGLTIPYLSSCWFDRVKFAVEAAKAKGLEVWLYDEYPYPSGMAGGEVVLQHPDAKHWILKEHTQIATGPQALTLELPWARVLTALAVPDETGGLAWEQAVDLREHIGIHQAETVFQETGLTAYNHKRFFSYGPRKRLAWQVPQGNWRIITVLEEEIDDFKYYGSFVDPCHEGAVETFIQVTHQRYARTVGAHFGGTVKGIFTDEVGFLGKLPWSPRLAPFFQEHCSYSLLERLPELLFARGRETAKVRYDYFQSVHVLLSKTYHEKVREWCDAQALKYVAEVPAARMATQRHSHIPGGDSAHEKVGRSLEWVIDRYALSLRNSPKMVSSLARQLGLERALIECFHSVGWSMTLLDAKWMIDRLAAFGINMFNFHAFFYTLDGLVKYDAPPSQFYQNPYWPHFRQLADYAARLSYIMSQGSAAIRVAVLDPVTSLWTHLGNPFHEFRYAGGDEAERRKLEQLKQDWAYIGKTLLMRHIDYDHLDPELLGDADVADGEIRIGKATYSLLILPPMTNLEAPAWRKIQAFLRGGGTVIALGLLPYEVIDENREIEREMLTCFSLTASPQEAYWQASAPQDGPPLKGEHAAYFLPSRGSLVGSQAGNRLVDLLDELAPRRVKLEGNEPNTFLLQHRILPDGCHLLFVSHQEAAEREAKITIDLPSATGQVERMDVESGEVYAMMAEKTAEGCRLALTFAPYQSYLFRLREKGTATQEPDQQPWRLATDANSKWWSIAALQPNVLRLDTFDLALGPEPLGDGRWCPVAVKTIIDQCAEVAEQLPLPLRFTQSFGTPMKVELAYPLTCWYRKAFVVEAMPAECQLLMDEGAISGDFALYLNGATINRDEFEPSFHYDHCNRRCDITPHLVQGANTLLLRVEARHDWDGLVEPLYLTGMFGVRSKARVPVIALAPEQASFKGFFEGYPYYAGELSLQRVVGLERRPDQREFEVMMPRWMAPFRDCAEVRVNGRSLGVRCWPPYRWTGSTAILKIGENHVEIRVTNTLVGMLEGKYFDYETHSLKDIA